MTPHNWRRGLSHLGIALVCALLVLSATPASADVMPDATAEVNVGVGSELAIDPELLEVARRLGEATRGEGAVRVAEANDTSVNVRQSFESAREYSLLMSDRAGDFGTVILQHENGVVDIQVFEGDGHERAMTVYVLGNAGSGDYSVTDTPVKDSRAIETSELRSDASKAIGASPSEAAVAQSSVKVCLSKVYEAYKSSSYVVGPAEIWDCTEPATLRLQIWLGFYSLGGWQYVTYLDRDRFGSYFYANELYDCNASTGYYRWRTDAGATATWPDGASDHEHMEAEESALRCLL